MYPRSHPRLPRVPLGNLASVTAPPLLCRSMALRCLLFSSDEGTAEPIHQVLASLGVLAEHCSETGEALECVTHENLQIVIIDWDNQPDAAQLLTAARERKAAERPLTLAIVSDDASVPKALQAGANSILRKPLQINQVKDTLTTARDLLRAKRDSAASAAQSAHAAAAAASSSAAPPSRVVAPSAVQPEEEPRAGQFLQPSAQSHAPEFVSSLDVVVPAKDMAPIAATSAEEKPPDAFNSGFTGSAGRSQGLGMVFEKSGGSLRCFGACVPSSGFSRSREAGIIGLRSACAPFPAGAIEVNRKTGGRSRVQIEPEHRTQERGRALCLYGRRKGLFRGSPSAKVQAGKGRDPGSFGSGQFRHRGRAASAMALPSPRTLGARPPNAARLAQPAARHSGSDGCS